LYTNFEFWARLPGQIVDLLWQNPDKNGGKMAGFWLVLGRFGTFFPRFLG
jgi:hypothetical protein